MDTNFESEQHVQKLNADEHCEKLRQMIAVGIAQADRGECVPWNVEEILANARAQHEQRKRAQP